MSVGVNDAARRLGVGPSTVSRQLARFVARGMMDREADGTFDFDRFAQLRAGTLNPLKARNVVKGRRPAAPETASPSSPPPRDDLHRAHTADKVASAALKRIELLDRAGKVCEKASVAAAATEAARALSALLGNRRRALAEELAAMTSADDVEARLADADRALLEQLRRQAEAEAATNARIALADVA